MFCPVRGELEDAKYIILGNKFKTQEIVEVTLNQS